MYEKTRETCWIGIGWIFFVCAADWIFRDGGAGAAETRSGWQLDVEGYNRRIQSFAPSVFRGLLETRKCWSGVRREGCKKKQKWKKEQELCGGSVDDILRLRIVETHVSVLFFRV